MISRAELTEKIVHTKTLSGVKWAEIAKAVGQSKEWTTAALMGQISLTKEQALAAGAGAAGGPARGLRGLDRRQGHGPQDRLREGETH